MPAQVLLCLAAVVLAVGRREQLMASLSQVALPDMAAAVLAVAALIRCPACNCLLDLSGA